MNTNAPSSDHKIALFGFYRYGNFGDDLMAAMVAKHLSRKHAVKVFGPSIRVGENVVPGTESMRELTDGADAIVYGGGGAFLRQREGKPVLGFDTELEQLCNEAERRDIPVHLVSVGGDGSPPPQLSSPRRHLLEIARSGTFRNVEEVQLRNAVNGPTAAYDDLVWATPSYISETASVVPRDASKVAEELLVSIDGHLYRSRLVRVYVRAIKAFARFRRARVRIRVLWQHKSPLPKGFPADTVTYKDLDEFITEIAKSDITVTSRLHMGLVAMSFGRVVVGFHSSPKQKMLFNRIGLSHLLFAADRRGAMRLAMTLSGYRSVRRLALDEENRYSDIGIRAESAMNHLRDLDNALLAFGVLDDE